MRKAESKRETLLKEHADLRDQIAGYETELDKLAEQARTALAGDKTFQQAQKQLRDIQDMHMKAAAKTDQAETDRARKGEPYEKDPLFMYLWRRQYGAKTYKANVVIAWLDEWVADLVDYHQARANYAVLLEIPERLNEHVVRLEEQLKTRQAESDALEAAKIKELAGRDLPKQIKKARKKQTKQNEST